MIRRPPRSTLSSSSAASDVYKRQPWELLLRDPGRVRARAEACETLARGSPGGRAPRTAVTVGWTSCWRGVGDPDAITQGSMLKSILTSRLGPESHLPQPITGTGCASPEIAGECRGVRLGELGQTDREEVGDL